MACFSKAGPSDEQQGKNIRLITGQLYEIENHTPNTE